MTVGLTRAGSTRGWRRTRAAVLERDGYVCHWCGAHASTVDHLTPRARGGGDEHGNLVAACTRCNLTRGAGPRATAPPSRSW